MVVDKVRHFVHIVIAWALYYLGVLALLQLLRRTLERHRETYVLGFHRVLTEDEAKQSHSLPAMILSETVFVDLIEYLKGRFEFIALDALAGNDDSRNLGIRPRCLVTFDDGWIDTYERAIPVLQRLQIPTVVFIPTGIVGARGGMWVERIVRLWKDPAARGHLVGSNGPGADEQVREGTLEYVIERFKRMPVAKREQAIGPLLTEGGATESSVDAMMVWEQLVDIRAQGVEIGSHTVRHLLLPYESDETIGRELSASRQELESRLGAAPRAFAYPNGAFDRRVCEWTHRMGYEFAFTTVPRSYKSGGDLYAIPRFLLHNGNVTGLGGKFSPAMLNLALAGWA